MTQESVTMKGNPLALEGKMPNVGDQAPDFVAVTNDLKEFHLSDLAGRAALILAVPSLDTSVCAMEARKFNDHAAKLGGQATIAVISTDLPFAQKRWCVAEHITKVKSLSDHRQCSFGQAYGVLIKELRLLARSIFVIDKNGKIAYTELVKEQTHEPNYNAALQALMEVAK